MALDHPIYNKEQKPNSIKRQPATKVKKSSWILVYNVETKLFLVLKRSKAVNNPGLWNLPGGTVEEHESPYQAALKELYEETGLKLPIYYIMNKRLSDNGNEKYCYYYITVVHSLPRVKANRESSAVKWVSLDALPKPLHAPSAALLNGYKNIIKYNIKQVLKHQPAINTKT